MGRAGIEPDVEDVGDLLPVGRSWSSPEEPLLGALRIPGVGALGLEGRADAGIDRRVAQDVHPSLAEPLHEAGERHAPGALARQHPVGPGLDHRIEAVAAGLRRPFDELVDGGQRAFADGPAVLVHAVVERLVDGDEPLRGVAVDHRRLGPPGMRVGMGEPPAGGERAGLDELLDHRLVGRAFLALGVEDLQAGEEGHVRGEGRVLQHVVGHAVDEAVLHEELEVVGAVAGRAVHEAGAGVVGDEIAFEHRDFVGPVGVDPRSGCRRMAPSKSSWHRRCVRSPRRARPSSHQRRARRRG
jgi:hypothetical protein